MTSRSTVPRKLHREHLSKLVGAALLFVASGALVGCPDTVLPTEYTDPTSLGDESVQGGIAFRVLSPLASAPALDPNITLTVSAYTEEDSRPVSVYVRPEGGTETAATSAGAAGPEQVFSAELSLTHGVNTFRIRVQEDDGSRNRVITYSILYSGEAPGIQLLELHAPTDGVCESTGEAIGSITNAPIVCATARVSTVGPSQPTVTLGVMGQEQTVDIDANGRVVAAVTLTANQSNTIVGNASAGLGSATSSLLVIHDAVPPNVTIVSPASNPLDTAASVVTVSGDVSDNHDVDSLRIESGERGTTYLPVTDSFSYDLALENGSNTMRVVATDTAGNSTEASLEINRSRVIRLRAASTEPTTAILQLDRRGMEATLPEADQRNLDLVEIELRPFVLQTLRAIQDPVRFGVDTSAWGPAEQNMFRLMNMTPDTADLTGTSMEDLISISSAIGLPSPRVLAELMQVEVTERFLAIDPLAEAILENVIGTHPNARRNSEGELVMSISLYDALQDLAPLAERFGPTGGHPGFIFGSVQSLVFEPGYTMSVRAETNLVQLDGIDASALSKDFIFTQNGEQVIEFDFLDEETFTVVGLVDEPTVSLSFSVGENPAFLSTDVTRESSPVPGRSGFFYGDGEAWTAQPWELERVVAETAFAAFADLWSESSFQHTFRYDAGAIVNAAVIHWDHGWVTIETSGGVGNPPAPTYMWGFLTEAAQVRLHDSGIAEGNANVSFELVDLPIGISSSELIEALAPRLAEQEAELVDLLFGDGGALATSGCDLYYMAGGSNGFLFFRDPSDTGPDDPYDNIRPGFYRDAGLATLVSTTNALSGTDDTVHHKVAIIEGAVWYFQDTQQSVFRLEVADVSPGEVGLIVTPADPQ